MELILEKIGLTKSEIKVYEALLELGTTSTGKIVDKAKVASSKIYEILDRLIDKGLVNYIIESGVKKFDAAPPERLMDYLKEKEKELNQQKNELEDIIPQLKLKQTLSKYKSSAKIYKGLRGVETAFYEALNLLTDPKTDEMLVIGIPSRTKEENRFFVKFARKRAEKNFRMRAIVNEDARGEPQTLTANQFLSEIKYNSEKMFAAINIFKNRTIIFPQTSDEPMVVVIDDKNIAKSFRAQFEILWNQETQTYEGKGEIKELFKEMIEFGDYSVLAENLQITNILGREFYIWWQEEKKKRGINSQGIISAKFKDDELLKEKTHTNFKYLDNYDSPGATFIFKDKIINIIYSENPVAIRINKKELAENYQSYFNLLWNQDVSVVTGFSEVTEKYLRMLNSLGEKDEYFVLGASLEIGDEKMHNFLNAFHKQRIEQKTKVKFLTAYEAFIPISERIRFSGDSEFKITQIKSLPPEFSTPFQINLFKDDTVWFTLWGKEIKCFELKSKEAYNNFRTYFDALWNQEITITKGFDALERVLIEQLDRLQKNNEQYHAIGAAFGNRTTQKKYVAFFNKLAKKRIKRKISAKILYEQGLRSAIEQKEKDYIETAQKKFLPYKTKSPLAIVSDNKKTNLILQKEEPIVITIDNEEISQSFQENFNAIWNQETRVVRGLDAVEDLFDEMIEYGSADFFAARGYFLEQRPKFIKGWSKRAEQKGFQLRNIVDKDIKDHLITKLSFAKTKYTLPKEIANLSVYWIFGNKVAIANWMGKEPIIVIIENKDFYKLYKAQFEELWNKAP